MTNISVRVDENIKAEAEELFEKLGLNMSTAINAFLKAAVREQGLPFEIKLCQQNEKVAQVSETDLILAIAKYNVLSHKKAYEELAK